MEFISEKLIKLIERDAAQLTKNWLSNVQSHPTTPTYHTYNREKLYERAFRVYSQLGKWISRETSKADIEKYYIALGKQRRQEGFALSEVIQALIITRRHVWLKVLADGFLETVLDHHQALELNNRVILYFDRAIFYTSLGYEKAG